jgi:hypothetical protein
MIDFLIIDHLGIALLGRLFRQPLPPEKRSFHNVMHQSQNPLVDLIFPGGMITFEVELVLVRFQPSRLAETGWFFYLYR